MRFSTVSAVALAGVSSVAAQSNSISQATFDNLIQYTRFSRASYAVNGCATPPNSSVVLQYFNDNATDAHATLFRWDSAKQIIIAFRGTYTPQNWNSDLDFALTSLTVPGANCSSCQVHEGFQKLYNALGASVLSSVKSALSSNPGYSLIVTGHSLGGALASLATGSLGASGVPIAATYTYGEPRNGNQAWGNYVLSFVPTTRYFRSTHANDGVPSLPPDVILPYVHHGTEYWQKEAGYNNSVATTVQCPTPSSATIGGTGENTSCNLAQNSGDSPINHAHVTYSNDVTGNVLHVHDCGAPFP